MTELNVKGMTVCTPEFHKVAKQGEDDYEVQRKVDEIVDVIDEVAGSGRLTDKQRSNIIRTMYYI